MIQIFDMEKARKSILKREMADDFRYPERIIQGVEQIFGQGTTPPQAVAQILVSVRQGGDGAIRSWSERLDSYSQEDFRIGSKEFERAYGFLSPQLRSALAKAANRIRSFHQHQPLPNWQTTEMGGTLGQRFKPIERVGFYVPGGTAPLPSSLLMSVIPAQVAGVRQLVVCTPPKPHPSILAAAHLCGLEELFLIGGAQAVAAMAYGTESVPKVDKIVGAGNLFVTLAKQQVFGIVGLDGLAGPTETMVIADETAKPAWVAADLLAQAEHDVLASAILLTPAEDLAKAVQIEVARQLEGLSRAEIIAESLSNRGGIVITPDLEVAVLLANEYAAEHLCLAVSDPQALMGKINNAGGIFLGERSFEVLGDYIAGPSHVMPTGGSARFSSPLNVLDFVKITSIIALDDETSRQISGIAAEIARVESLTAHAAAAQFRLDA